MSGGVGVDQTLPLLDRVDATGRYSPDPTEGHAVVVARTGGLIPPRPPGAGEQYRFHFDMTKCIGCKCCEVACAEQNNSPAGISWRRVGEIEGGTWPHTKRHYVSMGCNHCVDPACLSGCPVEAYTKAEDTGLVLHSAQQCIGCQYCTWNCPYGVPQFNPERKVVGKCDMCHGRLKDGQAPACVSSCPQGAITVELVRVEDWKNSTRRDAEAPGVPESGLTLSTTRITLPSSMPVEMLKADAHLLKPEHPHTPLIALTALSQIGLGAALGMWLISLFSPVPLAAMALTLTAMGLGLAASLLHLGRPIHAMRAMRGWRTSWLSREAIGLGAFMGLLHLWLGGVALKDHLSVPVPGGLLWVLGGLTLLAGAAGVYASARIYLVPARPAWSTRYTLPHFFLGGLAAGLLGVMALSPGAPALVPGLAAFCSAAEVGLFGWLLLHLLHSEAPELRNAGLLYTRRFRNMSALRLLLLLTAGVALPVYGLLQELSPTLWAAAGALSLLTLLMGRFLFFVTVVPRNIPGHFFSGSATGGTH